MGYRTLNSLLLVGLLFSLGCSRHKAKHNNDYAGSDTEVIDGQSNEFLGTPIVIEYNRPPVLAPVLGPPLPPVPALIPPPIPIVPIVVIDDDHEEECLPPRLVIDTGEPCVEPDHLLSYPFNSLINLPERTANLDDEFIAPADFILGDALRLLNPATKFHLGKINKPQHPNTHYLAISVSPDEELDFGDDKRLLVFNQFREHKLNIPDDFRCDDDGDPVMELLIPSVKKSCPKGKCHGDICDDCFPEGDHYLCYELNIAESRCPIGPATFADQFVKSQIIDRLIPKRLCNPVQKIFGGATTTAEDDESNHLVCYEVNDSKISIRFIELLNQLGEQKGFIKENNEICVPSTKLILPPEF